MSFREALSYLWVDDQLCDSDYLDEQEKFEKRTNRRWTFWFSEKELMLILSLRAKWMEGDHRDPYIKDGEIAITENWIRHMSIKEDGNVYGHQKWQSNIISYYWYADVVAWNVSLDSYKSMVVLWNTHDSGEARTLHWDIVAMKKENNQNETAMFAEYLEWVFCHLNIFNSPDKLTESENNLVYDIEKKLLKIYEINDNPDHQLHKHFSLYEKMSYVLGGVYALHEPDNLNDIHWMFTVMLQRQMKNFESAFDSEKASVLLFIDDYKDEIEKMFQYILERSPDESFLAAYDKREWYKSVLTKKKKRISELRNAVEVDMLNLSVQGVSST